jgi:leucyl/phenylalanyl-tRNA--protein transferase
MQSPASRLPWLTPGESFPPAAEAWGATDPAPGLLAAGGALNVQTLKQAYGHGIFPWFSTGQPILWWSPDPRMVLHTAEFRVHRSLRKTLAAFRLQPGCEIRFDSAFADVIRHCARSPRPGQSGTWIVPDMVRAYEGMHRAGLAHSIETWIDGELAGGLYCVALGRAVFGESMFTRVSDASKIALAALVAFCRAQHIPLIDCQQNTAHLATLGAREIARSDFVRQVAHNAVEPAPVWRFEPVYWNEVL